MYMFCRFTENEVDGGITWTSILPPGFPGEVEGLLGDGDGDPDTSSNYAQIVVFV